MTPKRSKELSKQDKDGNPIWLDPNLSKADEAFYKTCQATQDGTLLKEFNKLKRSKELEEILAIFEIGVRALALRNVEFKSLADEVRDEAITAIEKWAKEKYRLKPLRK